MTIRILLSVMKFALGFILLLNMDIKPIYISRDASFVEPGGVLPISFDDHFTNDTLDIAVRQSIALAILGNAHSNGGSGIRSIFLQKTGSTRCDQDPTARACYRGDLMLSLQHWNENRIASFNATREGFITYYKSPYYHIEVRLAPIHYTEPCRFYGCGSYNIRVICARKDKHDSEWLSTRMLDLVT
jgi:hypothetical protein